MIKKIFHYSLLAVALSLTVEPACSAVALREFCWATPRLGAMFRASPRLFSTFALPTSDKAFKEILLDPTVRNSLFQSLVDERIISSEMFGLSSEKFKGHDQVTMESIGAFLKKYRSIIEEYLKQEEARQHAQAGQQRRASHKKIALDTGTLVHELATKYYNPLCALFPGAEKEGFKDFTCRLNDDSVVLVEMQVRTQPYWNSRALAYAARIYASQLARGQDWSSLRRVYSVNVLGGYEPSKKGDVRYTWTSHSSSVLRRYQLTNRYNSKETIPDLEIIQIFPQLFKGQISELTPLGMTEAQARRLGEWLEFFKEAQLKDKAYVEKRVQDQGVRRAYTILEKPELAADYEEWRKTLGPVYADNIIQERAAGKEEGVSEATEAIAKRLLARNKDIKEIAETTGLSEEQLQRMKGQAHSGVADAR